MSTHSRTRTTASDDSHSPRFAVKIIRLAFRLFGVHLPGLMSRYAFYLWSRTHRYDAPAREQRLQLRASECSLTVNGLNIAAWRWGDGPSVLLVHGWNGRGMQLGNLVDPLLRAGYQVITFDAPGHGQSDAKHTNLLQIRDVMLALSQQHGSFHAVIGHSFGVAALSAAVASGMKVANLVAISSPGGLNRLIERYCQTMHIPSNTEHYLRLRLEQRIGSPLWQQFAESYPLNEAMNRALIIHDKEDNWVDWHESEQLNRCWPNSELLLTEGLGHGRILRSPSLIRKIVDFVDNSVLFDPLD